MVATYRLAFSMVTAVAMLKARAADSARGLKGAKNRPKSCRLQRVLV
ncbi:MAG: hypothetical protein KBE04_14150 [Phycisphaerae bacterium]|nr:hypothetical protein [Phycisphaerae bacterium]